MTLKRLFLLWYLGQASTFREPVIASVVAVAAIPFKGDLRDSVSFDPSDASIDRHGRSMSWGSTAVLECLQIPLSTGRLTTPGELGRLLRTHRLLTSPDTTSRETCLSDLFIVVFEGRYTADGALLRLMKMEITWEVDLYDVIVMSRDKTGRTNIRNSGNLAAEGYLGGGLFGGATGLLIGTMASNPAAGLVAGALAGSGIGGIAGILGSEDQEERLARLLGDKLKPDMSALGMIGCSRRRCLMTLI